MTALWIQPEELSDPSSPMASDAATAASTVLYMLSGQKYRGLTETTELYVCKDHSDNRIMTANWFPVIDVWWHPRTLHRGVTPSNEFRLRGRPVRSVSSVSTGVSALDPIEYELRNSGILHRTSGSWSFGICGGPGVLVSYTYGAVPPALGRQAARALADQLLLATTDPRACELPDRVTTISREGMSVTLLDPQDFLDNGRTGIYIVDLFLKTVNPGKARKPARVFSPDLPRAFRRNPT